MMSDTDILQWSGPGRDAALVFAEYADHIRREEGIDVYERKAWLQSDTQAIKRLLDKFRRDKTFADESLLDEVWQECLRDLNILTREEQQAKDEFSLQKARSAKDDLRLAGLSDAPRFGYCSKVSGCQNSKVMRLLVRGFCPDCRGIAVQQTIAAGGRFDAATDEESSTAIAATVSQEKMHPNVLKLTREERQAKVLAARNNHAAATEREIARLTDLPRSTVKDILRNPIVKGKAVISAEVQHFLIERAEQQAQLETRAREYLKRRDEQRLLTATAPDLVGEA